MTFQPIDLEDCKKMMEESEVTVVDVRDLNSYQTGHIQNAHLVNNANIHEFLENVNKKQALIVYCYHGNSSQGAAELFSSEGIADVYSLNGGYAAWSTEYTDS